MLTPAAHRTSFHSLMMRKFIFFGLGSAGSAMSCCLQELSRQSGERPPRFLFVVRDAAKARAMLFRAPMIRKNATFLEVEDFHALFGHPEKYRRQFRSASVFVNAASPSFNDRILDLALSCHANYCDLASDMYDEKTSRTLRFSQEAFHRRLKASNLFGLINAGVSPGLTNLLIGERLLALKRQDMDARVSRIHLFLREHLVSRKLVFSWSPEVALDELKEHPRCLLQGKLRKIEPFSTSMDYQFPHSEEKTETYPIYQEEILSLHGSFPDVPAIHVSAGGSEVDVIRALYQLNLLSDQETRCKGMTVGKIVRMVLPGLQSPRTIETYLKDGTIRSAQFAAMAEIVVEGHAGISERVTETVGVSFHRYHELLGTPYSGNTYLGYVTGVCAALLLSSSLEHWQKRRKDVRGIIKSEHLPGLLGQEAMLRLNHALSSYKIDVVSHSG